MSRCFSASTLKWIAVGCMLLDHLAWAFIETASLPGQICHLIGRVTAPVMCYFIAEGYFHTRNIKRYALRLGNFDFLALLLVFSNGTLVFRPVRNDLDPFDGASGFMELEASPLPFPAAVSSGSLLYPQPLGGLASCWCLIYIGIRLEPPARRSAEQAAGDRFQHPESGRSRCISHPSFSSGAFPCSSFLSIV